MTLCKSFSHSVASNDLYSFNNSRDSVLWNILGIHVLFAPMKLQMASVGFLQENAAMKSHRETVLLQNTTYTSDNKQCESVCVIQICHSKVQTGFSCRTMLFPILTIT